MPNLYTVSPGEPIAIHAAALMLKQHEAAQLSQAIVFVPTRRSAVSLRDAFSKLLSGNAMLLPRIIPLADIGNELLTLLGVDALEHLKAIPPAMPVSERRYLLARQIMLFEKKRLGVASLDYALMLADTLIALHDQATRAGIILSQENLRPLIHRDVADHWKQALQFLAILTDNWPEIERALGMTTAATREVHMLETLAQYWQENPPATPIYMVGSTASQPATARLMKTVAALTRGYVVLPGLATTIEPDEWNAVEKGHPLFHLKQWLDSWPLQPSDIAPLSNASSNLWLEAFAPITRIGAWSNQLDTAYKSIKLVACAHPEEEARIIAVIIREALEDSAKRTAVITPDEGLMARVANHLKRDGITANRLTTGTLAQTEVGSLWLALAQAIAEPHRPLVLLDLLRHPLISLDNELLHSLEKAWRGMNKTEAGKLPRHDPALKSHSQYVVVKNLLHNIKELSDLSTTANQWLNALKSVISGLVAEGGKGQETVDEALDALADAESLGTLDAIDMRLLISDRLSASWRDAGIHADTRVTLLTPVEARLECFDRVILASMTEDVWPGTTPPNPWMNLAMQATLGLPAPEEHISLMAHDVLMHGSGRDVFLTYATRKEGSPTARSRFIERLVTRLAVADVNENAITASHYIDWANAREASADYAPEKEVWPLPTANERPQRLPVTDIDKLFTDLFAIYAKHVLKLRKLDDIDATPEASDFGNLAHKAIQALTTYWNEQNEAASEETLNSITEHALRDLSDRPNIDLFWRTRLMNGLRFINRMEEERRPSLAHVEAERTIEGALADITLYGRIDRLEEGVGGTTVVDYKTGSAPTTKAILDGKALQLLTYAMLLDQPASSIEYWQLPRIGEEGEIMPVALNDGTLDLNAMRTQLAAALTHMRDPQTPFLAIADDERFGNDYDGISRYDEWAG